MKKRVLRRMKKLSKVFKLAKYKASVPPYRYIMNQTTGSLKIDDNYAKTVKMILTNHVYTGKLVHNKSTSTNRLGKFKPSRVRKDVG